MYYLMIIVSALCFSLQFLFNDGYKRECGSTLASSLKFSLYTSISGLILLLIINKCHLEFTLFSVAVALVYATVCIAFSYCSVKAFESASISVYSVFSMIGGMVLPFTFGLFMGEEFKLIRVVSCLVIVAAIIFTADKSGNHKGGFKYYISIFLLNGCIGIVSKLHQATETLCVDSASFMMIAKMWMILIASVALFIKGRNYRVTKKGAAFCGVYAMINSSGNLLALIALKFLPASVQYPLITGGTMFFAFVIGLIRRDKLTKKDLLGTVLAIAATIVIVL